MKKIRVYSLLIISMFAAALTACGKKEEVAEVQTEEVNMFGLTDEEQKHFCFLLLFNIFFITYCFSG